jgi:hypothetical protein
MPADIAKATAYMEAATGGVQNTVTNSIKSLQSQLMWALLRQKSL